MTLAEVSAFPAWQPHPEVWLLLAGVLGLGLYASRVIQPTVVAAGGTPITAAQRRWFVLGIALLWLASDWPVHDIAEERLYSVHMFQHLLYTVVIPPVFLLATPEWLGRLILGDGRVLRGFRRLARPVTAALIYNAVVITTHWAWLVNNSVRYGPLHYAVHVVVLMTALIMWTPVCGPFPEMRISPPARMIHIFLMSIIPTIPAAFLTTSEVLIYTVYDRQPRLWGISPLQDQQAAGLMMKLTGGFYLWGLILIMFTRWVGRENRSTGKFRGTLVPTVTAAAPGTPVATSGFPTEPERSNSG